jgi:sulfite dehydrogenase
LICPGVFVDNASWTGVPLKAILDIAGVQAGAEELVLVSEDGFRTTLPLKDALERDSLLAYEVNGQVLPILHGFPIRAVFPDMEGNKWIKWLVEIQVK